MKKTVSTVVLVIFLSGILLTMLSVRVADAWSNGGFSSDPSNPEYGTHDWIAQHALDWLPVVEKQYVVNNLAAYLYGTELPDNGVAPDGIGDTINHHVYFDELGTLMDDSSAFRAQWEFERVLSFLDSRDFLNASKTAGIVGHYIVDVAVFGHVMGSNAPWGAEIHHSDYETYVNSKTNSYAAEFNSYLSFDGSLDTISAYNATKDLAYDTTFDVNGDLTCVWMDQNYDWSNPLFKDRAGESLNLAVNYLADVLHTLYAESTLGQVTVFPAGDVEIVFENVTDVGSTTVNVSTTGPEPPPSCVVKEYYEIGTSANYSDKNQLKIIYGGNLALEEEASLQLMRWNETAQQWTYVTSYVDVSPNLGEGNTMGATTYLVAGETSHFSIFGVTCQNISGTSKSYQFPVSVGKETSKVEVKTNSTMSDFALDKYNKTISFNIEGAAGTIGFCNVTVPTNLLFQPYDVLIDSSLVLSNYTAAQNGTHAFLFFAYSHSSHMVEIIAGGTPLSYDLNRDGRVDGKDVAISAKAFNSRPTYPRWNLAADLNKDNKIDGLDIVILAKRFGTL